jgi:hypothetical protein
MGFEHGRRATGGRVVANSGGTSAKVMQSFYRVIFTRSDGLPFFDTGEEGDRDRVGMEDVLLVPGTLLNPGASCSVPISIIINMSPERPGSVHRFVHERWKIIVMGDMQYEDELGHSRWMGFCRKADGVGPFRVVEDPEFEYQD